MRLHSPEGVLFDRPTVIERARLEIEPELQGRMQLVGGDFFTSVPAGADAYLLKHVLHDWNDEDALRILQTCRRAMKPGSTILIVETIVRPGGGKETLFGNYADLLMLITAGGRERTAEEFAHLLGAAGFRVTGMVATGSPMSIVVGIAA